MYNCTISEKATKVEMHFLDNDASISNHTIVISAPEMRTPGLENATFKYDNFPETFNHAYFETDYIRTAAEANIRTSPIPTDCGLIYLIKFKHFAFGRNPNVFSKIC